MPTSRIYWKPGALVLCLCFSALGQIAQDHPELCGNSARYIPVPANITSEGGPWGVSAITLFVGGQPHRIELGVREVREICSIPGNKLVVFGFDVGYRITIVDAVTGAVIDSFMACDPVMSPDQHWIAMKAFQPPHGEVWLSATYLLYDLFGNEDAMAPRGQTLYAEGARGRILYPVLEGSRPFRRGDIPEADNHYFASDSFYWSPDSQSVVFADRVQNTLSVVLATIKDGNIADYVHPLSWPEVCQEADSASSAFPPVTLTRAEFDSVPGAATQIVAEFKSDSSSGCTPKAVTLSVGDFQPAKTEVYKPKPRKKSVGIDRQASQKQ